MKAIILFSICGSLVLEFEILAANEYDSTAWSTFEASHPNAVLLKRDIRKI